jgi:tetratricopeptide (TPR) repeat protein
MMVAALRALAIMPFDREIKHMISEEEFKILKAEVDTLQIQASEKQKPWISKPSNILSLFALVFSFGTTVFSFWNSYNREIASNRAEVRELIQRITRLPIENFDLTIKYKDNAQALQLSSMITQEQLLLANQAAEKINRFPDSFTSTEYFAVAVALANVNSPIFVSQFLQRAISLADTANDYVVSSRSYGHYLFTQGKIDEGRSNYSKALTETWSKFPATDPLYRKALVIQTNLNLANSEYMINNRKEALRAISDAQSVTDDLATSQAKEFWHNQVVDYKKQIEQGSGLNAPSAIVPGP